MSKEMPTFVRLNILEFWRWVQENTEDLDVKVIELADSLLKGKSSKGSFAAKLLTEASEFQQKHSEAGKKGMRNRWVKKKTLLVDAETGEVLEENAGKPDQMAAGNNHQHIESSEAKRAPAATRSSQKKFEPPTAEEMYDFCSQHNLDDVWGREWFEMHEERNWRMRDGSPMENWQGTLTEYVKSKQQKIA